MDNSIYTSWAPAAALSDEIPYEFESPFVASPTQTQVAYEANEARIVEFESPFMKTVPVTEGEETFDQREQLFVQFLDELAEEEFTEGVVDLFNEGERYLNQHLSLSHVNEITHEFQRQEELLAGHFQPLAVATEALTDHLAHEFSKLENVPLTEGLIDQVFDQYTATHELGNPVFEDFFKKAFKKIKRAAKKVANVVKKGVKLANKFHPLAILLRQVKKMIRPFLTKIIRKVIQKLPAALQAPARMLAGKLGIKAELGLTTQEMAARQLFDNESREDAVVYTAGPDLEFFEREFDLRLAEQLFAETEAETQQVFEAYLDDREDQENIASEIRLLQAREQLKSKLQEATTAQEVGPAVEQFLGVAMKAVKLGIRMIGREKVINQIAKLFTKFIGNLIGPEAAAPLAKALVEKGFRLLDLEVSAPDVEAASAETFVQILEEMVADVVTLDEEVLQDQALLEQEVYYLFRHYSGKNMPSNMVVEELQEAEQAGTWVMMPASGQKRYKKYSRVMETALTRDQVSGVRSFNGQPLLTFLRQNYQYQSDQPLPVRIHLYQAIRGTTLSHVTLLEKKTPGLGTARRSAWSQLHPLTPQVAGLLLGNAALGEEVAERWLTSRHRIQPGQRFYYLEVVGRSRTMAVRSPQVTAVFAGGGQASSRPGVRQEDAMVKFDFTRSTMSLGLFVTEDKGSEITRRLRAQDYFGAATTFRTAIRDALNGILLRDIGKKVQVVMELREERYLEEHFGGLLAMGAAFAKDQLKKLMGKLLEKLVLKAEKALENHLRRLRDDFIRAQEDPAEGLSLHLVFIDMPGMALLRTFFKVKRGESISVGDVTGIAFPSIPTPDLRIFPGKKAL